MKIFVRRPSAEKSAVAARRQTLHREIALMLAVKAALLYGIWLAFFSAPQLPKMTEGMDPGRVAATLIAPSTTAASPNP